MTINRTQADDHTLTRREIMAARGYTIPGDVAVGPQEPRKATSGTTTPPEPEKAL